MKNWNSIYTNQDVNDLIQASFTSPVLIFKHSTRCSISAMALNRMEKSEDVLAEKVKLNYLDLITYRDVSNYVAEKLDIQHESPQAILLINGEVKLNSTHNSIRASEILEAIQ